MATKLQDENTPLSAATPSETHITVLVFDSGVGGLSVYDDRRSAGSPLYICFRYRGFPTGKRVERFIVERVVEIVTAVQQRVPFTGGDVCNTASTVSLPRIRESLPGGGRCARD